MRTNLLYILLIGIGASSLAAGAVYGLGVIASPGINMEGANTLYALKVNPGVTATIAHIVIKFQGGYTLSGARIFNYQNIGQGTLSFPNSTALSYDVSSPQSNPAGIPISIILGNIINPSVSGSNTVTFATKNGSNNVIESGQITLVTPINLPQDISDNIASHYVGIDNTNPQHALDVGGDVGISGNITSTAASGKTLKITPPTNGAICIGSGC